MTRLEQTRRRPRRLFIAHARAGFHSRHRAPHRRPEREGAHVFVRAHDGGVTVASVVAAAHASKDCQRSGNMYGVRLLEDLNIDPEVGVARVSLVHYNTEEEVAALITALNEVLLG